MNERPTKPPNPDLLWDHDLAVKVCTQTENMAPQHGYHVGLTGGCLYKTGPRKDLDIILYPVLAKDQEPDELFRRLKTALTIQVLKGNPECDFVVKTKTRSGMAIDFLFPANPYDEEAYSGP